MSEKNFINNLVTLTKELTKLIISSISITNELYLIIYLIYMYI